MSDKAKRKRTPLPEIAAAVPFTEEDLTANRRGEITLVQRYRLHKQRQNWSWVALFVLLLAGGGCYRSLTALYPQPTSARDLYFVILVVVVICCLILLYLYRQAIHQLRVRRYAGNLVLVKASRERDYLTFKELIGTWGIPCSGQVQELLKPYEGAYLVVYIAEPAQILLSLELVETEEKEDDFHA